MKLIVNFSNMCGRSFELNSAVSTCNQVTALFPFAQKIPAASLFLSEKKVLTSWVAHFRIFLRAVKRGPRVVCRYVNVKALFVYIAF